MEAPDFEHLGGELGDAPGRWPRRTPRLLQCSPSAATRTTYFGKTVIAAPLPFAAIAIKGELPPDIVALNGPTPAWS